MGLTPDPFGFRRTLMKTFALLALALAAFEVGCATASRPSSHAGTTHIAVSGASGVVFTGFYVQGGRRLPLSNAVPWSLDVPRLSSLEIRKANPTEAVVVDLRYESESPRARITRPLAAGVTGLRVEVRDGLVATTF